MFFLVQNNGQQKTEIRNVGNYHGIEICGVFKIIITMEGPEAVTLTSDQPQLLNSVRTIVERGILRLAMNNRGIYTVSSTSPTTICNNNVNIVNYSSNSTIGVITAHITGAHNLTSLVLSGHSDVESRNTLITDQFHLSSSGSSSFNGSFKMKQLDVQISGSSNVNFNDSSDVITFSVSGSSSCHAVGLAAKMIQGSVSGCSNLTLKGSAETVSLNISGCSSYEALNLETKIARVSAHGSSNATIHCTQTLEADIKGSATVRYKGNAKVLKGSPTKIG